MLVIESKSFVDAEASHKGSILTLVYHKPLSTGGRVLLQIGSAARIAGLSVSKGTEYERMKVLFVVFDAILLGLSGSLSLP